MWQQLAVAAGFLVLDFIYHRWIDPPPPPPVDKSVKIPLIDEGVDWPILIGRCKVQRPILAWTGDPRAWEYNDADPHFTADGLDRQSIADGTVVYGMNMFFILGLCFETTNWPGSGVWNKIHTIYVNDQAMAGPCDSGDPGAYSDPKIDGFATTDFSFRLGSAWNGSGHEGYVHSSVTLDATGHTMLSHGVYVSSAVEILDGRPTQILKEPNGTPATYAGDYVPTTYTGANMMIARAPETIPGYRGFLTAMFYRDEFVGELGRISRYLAPGGPPWAQDLTGLLDPDNHLFVMAIGTSSTAPSFAFEASTYPPVYLGPARKVGEEANPADAILELLVNPRAKLKYPRDRVDSAGTFAAAALTLAREGNGYSRVIEGGRQAREVINEILAQVDGVAYEDPIDRLIKLKLIRPDYDPVLVTEINVRNCKELKNAAIGGSTSIANLVRVRYTSRQNNYESRVVDGHNQANIVGQDGIVREVQLEFPGVCTEVLAQAIADREFDARSRPISKMTAVVDRSFYRFCPGDVVALTFPHYQWDRVLFRVVHNNRGAPTDNFVTLDLIQEVFQVYRGEHRDDLGQLTPPSLMM